MDLLFLLRRPLQHETRRAASVQSDLSANDSRTCSPLSAPTPIEDDETSSTMTFGVVRGYLADRDVTPGTARP
jgi:hypothetical protein